MTYRPMNSRSRLLDRLYARLVAWAKLDVAQRAWLDHNFAALRKLPLTERRTYRGDVNDDLEPGVRLVLVWGLIVTVMREPGAVFLLVLMPVGVLAAIVVQLTHLLRG